MIPRPCFLVLLALLSAASGFAASRPRVVASNSILADLAQVVGGERVQVTSLLRTGADPHGYEPTPTDVRVLAQARLVVVNGLGFEPWINKLVRSSGFAGEVATASEGVTPLVGGHEHEPGHGHAHEGEAPDPHAWQDPRLVQRYLDNLVAALARLSPDDQAYFTERAAAYRQRLAAFDAWAREQFATVPAAQRKLVTSHDSLRYLARAYGFEVVALSGLQPNREPTARQLARLIQFIRRQGVRAVFYESTSNPKVLRLAAREAGVTIVTELYTDSLGPAGTPGDTYLGMMRANVEAIVRSLQ